MTDGHVPVFYVRRYVREYMTVFTEPVLWYDCIVIFCEVVNMSKLNIALLFGGMSSEHEVSRVSSAAIYENLNKEKYEIYKVGMTKDGRWFLTEASPDEMKDGSWETKESNIPAFISPDRNSRGLVTNDGIIPIDCVFLGVHGRNCEDGVLQGLLELSGIPYTGPGVTSSACSMDKSVTKLIAAKAGIDQADFELVTRREVEENIEDACDRVETHFGGKYPFFIKPANEGSSVGISKAHDREELARGLRSAAVYDSRILVEETIKGREIETAVLGNDNLEVAKIGEVLAANEFYDYEAKYADIGSETVMVDDISSELEDKIRETAKAVFRAMGCRGYSRIDFFLTEDGRVILNELNTLPGFTSISMYPAMWQASGLPYSDLLDRIIELAMEK